MTHITHHQHHATVVLDGDIEWPVIHDLIRTIENAVDYYHYTLIELRVRSLGGSNDAVRYLLERLEAWRERGVRFRTRALGRTSSGAALLVALGDERLAERAATLRFHGASMYRNGDVSAPVAAALHDKLTRANDRMLRRLVDRVLEGPHVPGEYLARETDREVLEGLCMGARPDPDGTSPARLQMLACALGQTVDTAIGDGDRKSLAHIYGRLFQIDRPISPELAATLGFLDRAVMIDSSASLVHDTVPSCPSVPIPFASPTGELARETLIRHILVLGDDPVAATRFYLAPLLAALAAAPEGDLGTVLVLDPGPELSAVLQILPPDDLLEFPPGPLVLDLMSGSHELASALERGQWIRAAVLILERTLSLVPGSPARVLSENSGRIVDLVIREGVSRAVSAVGFVLMLVSEPFHRRDVLLPDDGADRWLCTDLIERARGGEGELGPNVLSLASWLLAVAPARILTAAWEAFAGLGDEEWEVHHGLFHAGHALSGARDHARAVLAVAQAVLSPFTAPGATSLYFGCEPGLKQGEPLHLDAIVSRSTRARLLVHAPRDTTTGVLVATALKECFFKAVLDAPEPDSAGPTAALCGYVARDFERYMSAVDRRFLDHRGAFALLASRSLSAIEHAIPDAPGAEPLLSHALSACGTKVFLRSTDPRTQDSARSLAPRRPGQPDVLDVRPLSGLGPDECYLSAPDGRFERRRLSPWNGAHSGDDDATADSKVLYLGLTPTDPSGGDAA